jgi:hypothetical protein
MTSESAYPGDDPRRLLSSTRDLTRRVRQTQRATWFPLLVFAVVTFVAIPVYHSSRHRLGTCAAVPGGRICSVAYTAGFVYWPIALVLAYVAIAAFYIRRSRARGVGTRVRPYVIAGIILAVVMTGAALWRFHHPLASDHGLLGAAGPFPVLGSYSGAIGLALLVLAWAERNRPLLVLALGYLAVVLVPITFGWAIHQPAWFFLPPLVIDGSILLLGGIGFALAQRPWRRAA